jgi:hypothetical protein
MLQKMTVAGGQLGVHDSDPCHGADAGQHYRLSCLHTVRINNMLRIISRDAWAPGAATYRTCRADKK